MSSLIIRNVETLEQRYKQTRTQKLENCEENVKTNSEIFIEKTATGLFITGNKNVFLISNHEYQNDWIMLCVGDGLIDYIQRYVNLKLCTWIWDFGLDNRKERDRAVP